jgi:hypothetical protein
MNDWTLYAVYGFLIFVATVVAPAVVAIDKKRQRADHAEEDTATQA